MQLLWAMENHLSSQLAELKEVTDKTAEVAGDPHQLKGVDEVLRAASISRSSCRAARVEEYDKLTKQLVTKYFQTWLGVSGALILQNGLPMNLNKIIATVSWTNSMLSTKLVRKLSKGGRKKIHETAELGERTCQGSEEQSWQNPWKEVFSGRSALAQTKILRGMRRK